MTAEYRNVTVRTDGGLLSCYMTDSSDLFAEELFRLGYDVCGIDLNQLFRPLPESLKAIVVQMDELSCCLAITDADCIVMHRHGRGSLYVPLCQLGDVAARDCDGDWNGSQISSFIDWYFEGTQLLGERFGDECPQFKIPDGEKRAVLYGSKVPVSAEADFFDALRMYREYRGLSEVDLYKKAGISKQAFSKIRSGKVRPKRETVMAFAVALDLSAQDTEVLLSSAGYSFRKEYALFVMEKAVGFLTP